MSRRKSQKSYNFSTLAGRLRYARDMAELSLEQLAEKIGIPGSTIHNAEKGMDIKTENLKKIIRELGLNAEWVLFGEGTPDKVVLSEMISSRLPRSKEEDELNILLDKTRRVLTEGSEGVRTSLKSNIESFHHTVEMEKRINTLEIEVERLKHPGSFPDEESGAV